MTTLEPLVLGLGARVVGAAAEDLPAGDLRTLLDEHHVLFFSPSDLDDDRQQALLDQLGNPYIHPLAKMAGATTTRCGHIVDDADHPPYQDNWHTDVTWDPTPPTIGSLRAIDMPTIGGNTAWANMHVAVERLPDDLRSKVEGLVAVHDMGAAKAFTSKTSPELVAKTREAFPGVERPVIATHRTTGRPYLNVNSAFTSHIVDMAPERSTALLSRLYQHVAALDCTYEHEWTVGEFALWDEQSTQHRALPDHFPQRREMSRYVVC